MSCEEARRLLLEGSEDPAAELHLAVCARCFEWLEARDPLVPELRASKPQPALAPARLAGRVLAAWQPQLRRRHWEVAAAGVLAAAAAAVLAAYSAGPLLAVALSSLQPLAAIPLTLLEIGRSVLLSNPAWLSALLVLASGLCLVSLRWFQRLQEPAA